MSLVVFNERQLRETASVKWTQGGADAIGVGVAEMDFGTAPAVANRLHRAIDQGLLGYTPKWTVGQVAKALASFQREYFGWNIDPAWVRPANSVLQVYRAMIQRLLPAGLPVIVPTPAYMPFIPIARELGRQVVEIPSIHQENLGRRVSPAEAWTLDYRAIEQALLQHGGGLVVLCNPWNPTGRILSTSELLQLSQVVRTGGGLVFADEIHAPLTPAQEFTSYASLGGSQAAHTVTAVAASKGWNIAGLPAAQVILPDENLRHLWDTQVAGGAANASGAGTPTALGAIGAEAAYLQGGKWLSEVRAQISANLDVLDQGLQGTRLDYTRPEATYLTWIGFQHLDLGGLTPQQALAECNIFGIAGIRLGQHWGQWVRLNAATTPLAWEKVVHVLTEIAK